MKRITKGQIKMVHVLKNALAMDDAAYRAGLYIAYGVRTCKDLNLDQANGLIASMKRMLGEKGLKGKARSLPDREGMATERQLDYILGLWAKVSRYSGEADRNRALRAFVQRTARVSDARFLTKSGAVKVINALKAMQQRKTEEDIRLEAGKFSMELSKTNG